MQISNLLLEAQTLRSQNRLEEAKTPLRRILELDPAHEAALAVMAQVEADLSKNKSQEEQDVEIAKWLAAAGAEVAAGRLPEAGADVTKILRLRPNHPEALALRKQIADKTAELGRRQKEQSEAALKLKQKETEDLVRQAEEQVRSGRYAEAQTAIDRVLGGDPGNAAATEIRTRISTLQANLKSFDRFMAEKSYEDALNSLQAVEKLNRSDPSVAEMRRRLDAAKASSRATVTVYRLADPGTLTLDGQPFGNNGEADNRAVPVGRHRLAVRDKNGRESGSVDLHFADGSASSFVYDGTELRPMTAADRDKLGQRRERERTVEFPIEHQHGGVFRKSSCTGQLLLSGFSVEYRTTEKEHAFQIPFASAKLVQNGERFDFIDARSKEEHKNFKARDAAQARALSTLWDRLSKLK
jgi:tetratricopeptide (TPR) repeat protein